MVEKILEMHSVSKNFSGKPVIYGSSMYVRKNEIFGIIGKSGAGKTTLLRLMIGYYKPDKGKILFMEKDFSNNTFELRSRIGFVTQDDCFYDELTVMENLEYFGKMYDVPEKTIRENTKKLLKFLQLEKSRNTLVKRLSGGMKRRVDFACAMIHNPDIIIMDEPTSGLDPILRKHFWDLIKYLKSMGKTVIFSSHMLEEIDQLCDSVAIVNKGTISAFGTISSIRQRFSKNYELRLETYPGEYSDVVELFKKYNISVTKHFVHRGKLIVFTSDPHDALKDLIKILDEAGERLVDVSMEKPRLDEIFEFFVEERKE